MLHKAFNEKDQKRWHRTETKEQVCRGQGGKELGPFAEEKGDDAPASADLTAAGDRQAQA